MKDWLSEDEISRQIIGCAIEVHRTLGGPGLLEKVYQEALIWELGNRGLDTKTEQPIPITYKGRVLSSFMRLDILVENRVIVEVKATSAFNPIFKSQALTYLRQTNLRLALVINFGEQLVRDGIHRVVNNL